MIRTVIGFFVAAVAICAFIVFGTMNTNSTDTTDNIVEVTRAEVDPVSELLAPQVTPVVKTTVALPEMANTASRVLAATHPQAPARGVSIDNSSIQDTTAGVLAALGLETAAPASQQAAPHLKFLMFHSAAAKVSRFALFNVRQGRNSTGSIPSIRATALGRSR